MNQDQIAYNFEYIPKNGDKSSIKVFQNAKESFSLEYSIFNPKTVNIKMYAVEHTWFSQKKQEKGLATIKQFASRLGVHPDFQKIEPSKNHLILKMLHSKFKIDTNDPKSPTFYSGGLIASNDHSNQYFRFTEDFSDNLLEILTDNPEFAFIQFVFRSIKLPKELKTYESQSYKKKNYQKEDTLIKTVNSNIFEESGSFEFSPRILIVETNRKVLTDKLNRLSVIFVSNGFKVHFYPSFRRRFSSLKKVCLTKKIISPVVLDGYSLMNFILPPQQQFSHEGYSFIPNKIDYSLATGVKKVTANKVINIGIPVISGKTSNSPLLVEGKDLNRHMAVFGMTGEGKSRFIYGLVKEFYKNGVNFLIFDPKGEYLQPIQSICEDFIYLKPGSKNFPWGINLFQIPQNSRGEKIIPLEDHIQFVVSILENIFEESESVSPQMRRLLHLAVIKTVQEDGNFKTFISWIKKPKALGLTGAYLENTSASVINRFEKLLFGNTGRCLSVKQTTLEITELLNRNAIIDLSMFESIEDQIGRQIFLDIIFQFLYYYARTFRSSIKEETLPKNIFVLDEIQKLLPTRNNRSYGAKSMIGKGPWTLRAYDISMIFVGTDPIIDQPILTNTGVISIFYTNFDPYLISNLLGIPKHEYEQLRNLLKVKTDERRCILTIDGKISLLRTNEFKFSESASYGQDAIINNPLQQKFRESYQKNAWNLISLINK